MITQSEKEKDTKRRVAVDLRSEATNMAAGVKTEGAKTEGAKTEGAKTEGAKTEGAAAERNEAGAGTGRAGTEGARPGTTRSTGQRLKAASCRPYSSNRITELQMHQAGF